MAVIKDYVQYDVKLPSRGLLITAITAGWLVLATGLATLIWAFVVLVSRDETVFGVYQSSRYRYCSDYVVEPNYYRACGSLPSTGDFSLTWLYQHWYLGFVPLVVGTVFVYLVQRKYNRFYRNVRQGKILQRDTNGGGNMPLDYVIFVEGYTYANKFTTQWLPVNAGYWHEVRVGDWFDFRN